jgi:AraC-like DNA-binding protein
MGLQRDSFWSRLNIFLDILRSKYTLRQIALRNKVSERTVKRLINELSVQSQVTIQVRVHPARALQDIDNMGIPRDSVLHGRLGTKKRDSIMSAIYRVDADRKKLWTSEEVAEIINTVKDNQSDMNTLIRYLNS